MTRSRETCYYCDNRGHDSGGLCTNCNKSWFGPLRKTILGQGQGQEEGYSERVAAFEKGHNSKLLRCWCGEFSLNIVRWYYKCITETVSMHCKDCGQELEIVEN